MRGLAAGPVCAKLCANKVCQNLPTEPRQRVTTYLFYSDFSLFILAVVSPPAGSCKDCFARSSPAARPRTKWIIFFYFYIYQKAKKSEELLLFAILARYYKVLICNNGFITNIYFLNFILSLLL